MSVYIRDPGEGPNRLRLVVQALNRILADLYARLAALEGEEET